MTLKTADLNDLFTKIGERLLKHKAVPSVLEITNEIAELKAQQGTAANPIVARNVRKVPARSAHT